MKLKTLVIHNIASIEDATIDFDSAPLCDSDVFLITGKTGAGKSTILDAICLALFATTPRLSNSTLSGKLLDGDSQITERSELQLLRRNCAEGSVTLTFDGIDGIPYKAFWGVRRAGNKVSGRLQRKQWELTNLQTLRTETKDKDINESLSRAIGLSFDQFCRTTLLAQNDFTKFLNSKEESKAEILEKITGTDIYSKIGQKIFEISSQYATTLKSMKSRSEELHLLTNEELDALSSSMKELEQECIRLRFQNQSLENTILWIKQHDDFTKQLKEVEATVIEFDANMASENMQRNRRLIDDWNTTEQARHHLLERNNNEKQLNLLKHKVVQMESSYVRLLAMCKGQENTITNLNNEIHTINLAHEKLQDMVPVYTHAQQLLVYLRNYYKVQTNMNKTILSMKEKQMHLDEVLTKQYEEQNNKITKIKQDVDKAVHDCEELEKKVSESQLTTLRESNDSLLSRRTLCETAIIRLKAYRKELQNKNEQKKHIEMLSKQVLQLAKVKTTQTTLLEQLQQQYDSQRKIYESIKLSVDDWAKQIRHSLHKGDTCPVCRQVVVQDVPNEGLLDSLFSDTRNILFETERKLHDAQNEAAQSVAQYASMSETLRKEELSYNDDSLLLDLKHQCDEACLAIDFKPVDNDVESLFTIVNNTFEECLAAIEQLKIKILAAEQLTKQYNDSIKKRDDKKTLLEKELENLQTISESLKDFKNQIDTDSRLIQQDQETLAEIDSQISPMITPTRWGTHWKKDVYNFAVQIKNESEKYLSENERLTQYTTRVEECSQKLNQVNEIRNKLLELQPFWKNLSVGDSIFEEDILGFAHQLMTDLSVGLESLQREQDQYNINNLSIQNFLNQQPTISETRLVELISYQPEEIATIVEQIQSIQYESTAAKGSLKQIQKSLEQMELNKPSFSENDTLDNLLQIKKENDDKIDTAIRQIGGIKRQLEDNNNNQIKQSQLKQEIQQKENEYQQWYKLNELYGDATGKKFRTIAQSYVLSDLISKANVYLTRLTDRYRLEVQAGTFVISVVDAYQGFLSRSVTTISGGESFLVSLSLALALSDIGEQLPVDTLFIDEGFGTLSGEPLNRAIELLRSLHAYSHRHVGIISHIDELRNRIPVQIRLTQNGDYSSSKVEVVG